MTISEVLKEIQTRNYVCYFISPHFDDMVLSSGALASKLAETNKVVVVNVFTQAGRLNTLSAKTFLKQCGYTDAIELYKDREREDQRAIGPITDSVVNLGFSEALWRRKTNFATGKLGKFVPEIGSVYPTYRLNIGKGKIARSDHKTIAQIEEKLRALMNNENAVVFCPMGVGSHVDHVIVHDICQKLFKNHIYWADFPYTTREPFEHDGMMEFSTVKYLKRKSKYLSEYKTQLPAMFGNKVPASVPEYFQADGFGINNVLLTP